MIVPNKIVTLENSALGLATIILDQGPNPIGLLNLYDKVSTNFESIDQFILTLDLLYVLGSIDLDYQTGIISYVI